MAKENKKKTKVVYRNGGFGGVYFLGVIASAIYFIQHEHGFWGIILALLKSLVWPAFVIYRALVLMKV